ncbi:hypothetical protein MH117_04865 [Paenibacillus sp. ACRRX]|nr:hypothetical protein [Paenibacillus sp. ACRRX]MCG7406741.1 hypothetical protein [Paenibacillus sp. ACRRX]
MTAEQLATIDLVIAEYMTLYNEYLDEPDADTRAYLKTEMEVLEQKYGF